MKSTERTEVPMKLQLDQEIRHWFEGRPVTVWDSVPSSDVEGGGGWTIFPFWLSSEVSSTVEEVSSSSSLIIELPVASFKVVTFRFGAIVGPLVGLYALPHGLNIIKII